jgi:hypothetical protein
MKRFQQRRGGGAQLDDDPADAAGAPVIEAVQIVTIAPRLPTPFGPAQARRSPALGAEDGSGSTLDLDHGNRNREQGDHSDCEHRGGRGVARWRLAPESARESRRI